MLRCDEILLYFCRNSSAPPLFFGKKRENRGALPHGAGPRRKKAGLGKGDATAPKGGWAHRIKRGGGAVELFRFAAQGRNQYLRRAQAGQAHRPDLQRPGLRRGHRGARALFHGGPVFPGPSGHGNPLEPNPPVWRRRHFSRNRPKYPGKWGLKLLEKAETLNMLRNNSQGALRKRAFCV